MAIDRQATEANVATNSSANNEGALRTEANNDENACHKKANHTWTRLLSTFTEFFILSINAFNFYKLLRYFYEYKV